MKKLAPVTMDVINISSVHNTRDAIALVLRQTKPLFQKPHALNMIVLTSIVMVLYFVSTGMIMW